jgi:hypothetical protein
MARTRELLRGVLVNFRAEFTAAWFFRKSLRTDIVTKILKRNGLSWQKA